MSITNRGDLSDKIYKWLIRDGATDKFVTPDMIQTYIQLAESELNRELKIQDLIATVPLNISTVSSPLPSDFRGVVALEFDSIPFDCEWFPTRREMKDKYYNSIGRPPGYIIQGGTIIFSNTPDISYPMTLDYYQALTPLTSDNDVNVILSKFPDAYLYGCVRQGLLNLNVADRIDAIATLYQNIIDRIKEDDKNQRFPVGGAMKPSRVMGG